MLRKVKMYTFFTSIFSKNNRYGFATLSYLNLFVNNSTFYHYLIYRVLIAINTYLKISFVDIELMKNL